MIPAATGAHRHQDTSNIKDTSYSKHARTPAREGRKRQQEHHARSGNRREASNIRDSKNATSPRAATAGTTATSHDSKNATPGAATG